MQAGSRDKVIVVGTSAGGLKALSKLLEAIPLGYPFPIIIVQHRSQEPKDLLEVLLQSKTKLVVKQADEKESIKPGIVYIAPPDYHLLVEKDHTFSLSSDEHVHYSRPSIDVLFESAAEVYKEKLIAIILTGANADGRNGIKTVQAQGGLTIAQNPGEADFPVMPEEAIGTRKVKHIYTLPQIQHFLLSLIHEQS